MAPYLIFGAAAGYSIVFSFAIVAVYAFIIKGKKLDLRKGKTISDYATNPSMKPYIMLGCIIIASLNLPFMVGLNQKYLVASSMPAIIVSALTSLFLLLTAMTVGRPRALPHIICGVAFCSFLLLDCFFLSLKILPISQIVGGIGLFTSILTLLMAGALIPLYKLNGVTEITYLGLNSVWILVFATSLLS